MILRFELLAKLESTDFGLVRSSKIVLRCESVCAKVI